MRTKMKEQPAMQTLPSRKAWNEQRAQDLIDAIASRPVKGMTHADHSRLMDHVRELGEVLATVRNLDDGAPF
jgi:hypothetical protein